MVAPVGPRRGLRYQPPVASPLSIGALARGVAAGFRPGGEGLERVRRLLAELYGARAAALTDSGTSALVLALRLAAPPGSTVALPAYACVDLVAAVVYAGMRARLYDIDPSTLGPDLDSLGRALGRGAQIVVVAHLYGYPADVPGVQALAAGAGAVVIEDAAQQAGGRLGGTRLGAFGPLTVLSFGRGKGTTGGRGGALLATAGATGATVTAIHAWGRGAAGAGGTSAGWGDLSRAGAQWVFARPWLYGVPASLPALQLGATVYRPAHEPARLSRTAAALVARALARMDADRDVRAARAAWYEAALGGDGANLVRPVVPIGGASSGYLRLPVLAGCASAGQRAAAPALGVVRTYPRPLGEEPAIAGVLHAREPATPGARELCDRLFTLPTHDLVSDADAERVVVWARGAPRREKGDAQKRENSGGSGR